MTEFQSLLKRMIVSAINAREVESQRVSRTLHDEVGQVLSAVGLHLDVLKLDFKDRVPEIVGRVREIQEYLEKAVIQVRALSYDLNPAVVERAGLHAALDRLVGRFRTQFDGSLRLLYDMNGRPPLPIGNAFYKIAELALDNAVQHARAKRIEVQVRSTRDALIMAVTDDGAGFSPEDADVHTPGLGILMMEHYAAQAAVELRLRSRPGRGTLVKASYRIKDSGPQGESEPHAL
jgi:signal transduction histidine kinase